MPSLPDSSVDRVSWDDGFHPAPGPDSQRLNERRMSSQFSQEGPISRPATQRWSYPRLKTYLNHQIAEDILFEAELMILAAAAGINDAYTYTDYGIFASNQTGNTSLLAVGALRLTDVDLENVGFSIGMFCLGGLLFGQTGHRLGRTRRSWLIITNCVQCALIFLAAALRKWVAPSRAHLYRHSVIALLAFASGGQVAMARTGHIPEITTAMVTAAYIDLFTDAEFIKKQNRPRNRRFCFLISLLVGCFIGAAGYKTVGPAFALLLAALAKLVVCILMFLNTGQ